MNWCLIIPLLVGAICAILGYLLGKFLSGGGSETTVADTSEIDAWKKKYAKLEADLADCMSKLSASSGTKTTAAKTAIAAAAIPFDADLAKSVFGKKIKKDDLKIIEGIGPKIEELFKKNGVKTWRALSEASEKKCQEILDSGGKSFGMHEPGTWSKQAKLAYEGKWKKLLDWQDELSGGKK
ncbi:hypothetical protein OOZ15_11705 [Galbibacter sp. EGI 63066]|uniref:hypothetical protein n=1 Tax=Galbibacter sp. EGI 63066 TaxID=2993559 RepID=UPI002248A148|nr:hypothetical protein [Galbibacter sp. EGI 63066]MCX2680608.1 hypothetical protein [Galbibacter sp. EGI 63066]